MDILNFISWIRGGRVVSSVDPNKTLIPVGLKDGRRDDDYLAGVISVTDLAAQVGGLQTVAVDGVTITGDGTPGDPLVASTPAPPYKVYSALITQSGTSNPTVNELSDSIGLNISFNRYSPGSYGANLGAVTALLPASKTIIICSTPGIMAGGPYLYTVPTAYFSLGGPNVFLNLNLFYIDSSGNQTPADVLSVATYNQLYLEIRVYP